MRHARTALAAVLILALGVSAFFVFPSRRTHPPRAGSTSDPGQMIGSIRTTSPSALPVKIDPAKWAQEYGTPVAPQIEEEVPVPEPLERYSVAQPRTKTEKQASHRNRYVARPRPNLFKKLVTGFIKLQKRRNHLVKLQYNPAARLSKNHSPRTSESSAPENFEYFPAPAVRSDFDQCHRNTVSGWLQRLVRALT